MHEQEARGNGLDQREFETTSKRVYQRKYAIVVGLTEFLRIND